MNNRSSAPAKPAPNMVPLRVVPVTCGTPVILSRTTVTSARGRYVRSTWLDGTPKEASEKNVPIWSSRSPA